MSFRTNVSLKSIIDGLGLGSGLKLVLDAGDAASYTSGQSWLDRSGNGYDFFRGTGSGSDAADPTFNGTPGNLSPSEYWSFDGGDFFRYDTTNETWMQNIHKNNAQFTILAWLYPASFASNVGVCGTSSSSTANGFSFRINTSGQLQFIVGNNDGTPANVLAQVSSIAATAGVWNFVGVSLNEAVGAGGLNWRVNGSTDTDSSTYTSPATGNAIHTMELGAIGVGILPLISGSRLAMLAVWEGVALTQQQIADIYHNLVIVPATPGTLTLSGKAATFTATQATVKADLTLTGKAAASSIATTTIKGDLALTGRNAALFTTSYVNHSDLLLQGRDATFAFEQATAKGDLTLTGYGASFATTLDAVNGALTLSGQYATLTPSGETIEGNLTLTARDAFLRVIEIMPTIKGDLVLTGFDAAFSVTEPVAEATLLLTGRAAALTPTILTTPGRLVLTPNDAELKAIGGGNGGDGDKPRHRKKPRTGFEPIAKKPDRQIIIKRDDFMPPDDLFDDGAAPVIPDVPPPQPDFVETDAIMALRADIATAQDLSDIERILREMDLDEQDLSDIMDILELID